MKIYVASSWRNPNQPRVVNELRKHGHKVYDFRNPGDGALGFQWEDVNEKWRCWDVDGFKKGLKHPVAIAGYERDMAALSDADVCLMVLPCGRSAHLEAGYAAASGKKLNDHKVAPSDIRQHRTTRPCHARTRRSRLGASVLF